MTRKAGKGSRKLAAVELADEDDLLLRREEREPVVLEGQGAEAPPAPEALELPGLVLRKKPTKRKESVYLEEELAERLRNTTGWLQAKGYSVSKGDIAAVALERYLTTLEQEHHGGEPFPRYRRRLKQGQM